MIWVFLVTAPFLGAHCNMQALSVPEENWNAKLPMKAPSRLS